MNHSMTYIDENFNSPGTSDRFNTFDYEHLLERTGEQNFFYCPNCNGHKFSISKKGVGTCWHGCDRSIIAKVLIAKDRELNPHNYSSSARSASQTSAKSKTLKPAPLPETSVELAKFPEIPQSNPEITIEPSFKNGVQKTTTYIYDESKKVIRKDFLDRDGNSVRKKSVLPYHKNKNGEYVCGKGDAPWPFYRWDEVIEYAKGKWIVLVEGEKCVEYLRSLGIIAITLQGSNFSEQELDRLLPILKEAGVAGVVCIPDNDEPGMRKMNKAEVACSKAELPCIIFNLQSFWLTIPEKGDIADWIESEKQKGMTIEDLIRRLEQGMHNAFEVNRGIASDILIEDEQSNSTKTDRATRVRLALEDICQEKDGIERRLKIIDLCTSFKLKRNEIEELVSEYEQNADSDKPFSRSIRELFNSETKDFEYLIPGMLPKGETILLIGDPKTGKSLLMYDAGFAAGTGEDDFLEQRVEKGKVLIVQTDESPSTAKSRLLKRGFRDEDEHNVRYIHNWDISKLQQLEEEIKSFEPTLIIVDSLRSINLNTVISENSAEFANQIYRLKQLFTRYNASGILIHHSNKNLNAVGVQKARGSSAIAGAVWATWQMEHIPEEDPNDSRKKIIKPQKLTRILQVIPRDGEGQRLTIRLDPENNHWINEGQEGIDPEEQQEEQTQGARILKLLRRDAPEALEPEEIQNRLKLDCKPYKPLSRLEAEGKIGSKPSARHKRKRAYFYIDKTIGQTIGQDQGENNLSNSSNPDSVSNPGVRGQVDNTGGGGVMEVVHEQVNTPPLPNDEVCPRTPESHAGEGIQELDKQLDKELDNQKPEKSRSSVQPDQKLPPNYAKRREQEAISEDENEPDEQPVDDSPEAPAPTTEAEEPALKVGDRVAHADPYQRSYEWHGIVTYIVGELVNVIWDERQDGRPYSYCPKDLRRLATN